MKKLFTKRRLYDALLYLALGGTVAALVMFPEESVKAGKDGVELCMNVIIPSLFPFFVISTLVVELGIASRLGKLIEPVMSFLFNVNGSCSAAFVLGFIGGYPVGAKTALSLYEKGECGKAEAERLLSFCNNSGPAFILGVVGAGVFSSSLIGLLLYFAHALASVVIGVIFRNWGGNRRTTGKKRIRNVEKPKLSFALVFTNAIKSSFSTMLNICGFVIFFTVFIKMLFLAGAIPAAAAFAAKILSPLGMSTYAAEHLITGFIEISSGVSSLRGAAAQLGTNAAMASFMLGWAGLSVHCQTLSFMCDSGLSARTYIMGKFMHGMLSAAFVFVIFKFVPIGAPVSSFLAEQVAGIAGLDFTKSLLLSTGCSILILMCLLLISYLIPVKRAGNKEKR